MRKTTVVQGTMLLTAGNLAIRCVSMLFGIYLSAELGAAGLGLMQLISSVSILAMTFGSSGVRVAAMYLTAEEYGQRRPGGVRSAVSHCMAYGLLCSSVVGLLLMLLSGYLSRAWLMDPRAASSLRLLGFFLPVTCLNSVMTGYFTACGKIRQMVVIELSERLFCVFLTVILLKYWAGRNIERACLAIYSGSAITVTASFLVMYILYLADQRRTELPPDLRMGRRLIRLCVPLAANEYLRSGLSTLEHLLIPRGLRRYGSSGEAAMATYGVIHGMVFPVITFASAILFSLADVLVPELASCKSSGNQERIRHLTDKCLRWGLAFSAGVAGLLCCLAEPLGILLYRSTDAGRYIALLAPMVLILYLDTIVDGMHKGLGQQLYCVRYNTLTSFLDVILLYFLLPRWGVNGFLFSFVLTHLINFWLSLRRLVSVTEYRLSLPFSFHISLAALIAVLPIRILLHNVTPDLPVVILSGLAYVALFSLLVGLSSAFSREDARWLRKVFRLDRH